MRGGTAPAPNPPSMRRGLLLSFSLILAIASPGFALPDEPPGAHLRYRGERIQRAHLGASCWPDETGAMGCGEVTPMTWPKTDRVRAGARLRLRIHWRRKPNR